MDNTGRMQIGGVLDTPTTSTYLATKIVGLLQACQAAVGRMIGGVSALLCSFRSRPRSNPAQKDFPHREPAIEAALMCTSMELKKTWR
jgi:hypothetical protein